MLKFKRRAADVPCDPSNCSATAYIEKVLGDFTGIAEKLTEGQVQMQINLAKLTEAMGGIKRLDGDLTKLEDKVDKNSQVLWKVVGVGMALAMVIPLVIQNFM